MFKIAIDGPAGAGKSTIAKIIANKLSIEYIDTGAMYRAVTLKGLRLGANLEEDESYDFLKDTVLDIENGRFIMDGEDVSTLIRSVEITENVSTPSKIKCVREFLVDYQRKISHSKSVVMDGRDIGTVVLPDAEVKIYLDASVECRALRRRLERLESGIDVSLEDTIKEIEERDKKDSTRLISPLRCADDAVRLDTSDMSIDEVVNFIINVVNERGLIMSETKNYFVGQTVRGTVTGANENAIYLEIEEGVNAVIYSQDMLKTQKGEIKDNYCEGSEFSAQVKSIGKDKKNADFVLLVLSERLEQDAAEKEARAQALVEKMNAIQAVKEADEVIKARIGRCIKGGVELTYNNTKLFLPFTQVDKTEEELKKMKGETIDVVITFINEDSHFIAVSHNAAMKKLNKMAKEEAYANVAVGQVYEAEVIQILPYGAIVSTGLLKGLLHISEIDHFPVHKVENVLKAGQKINVQVVKVNEGHIGFSMKALVQHPWETVKEKFHVGDVFDGRVQKIIEAGLIIKLTEKYSGLMPRNEYAWQIADSYEGKVTEGSTIQVKVMNIDDEKQRVLLSHKALENNVWGDLGIKRGDVITVTVAEFVKGGANVKFKDVIGFMPIGEVATQKRIATVGEVYGLGQQVEVRVKDFDPRRARLVVSAKAALQPVEEVVEVREKEPEFVAEEGEPATATLGDLLGLKK